MSPLWSQLLLLALYVGQWVRLGSCLEWEQELGSLAMLLWWGWHRRADEQCVCGLILVPSPTALAECCRSSCGLE